MVVCFWIGFLGLSKSNKTIRFVGCLLNLLYLVRCSSRASWIALFLGLVVYYVLSYFGNNDFLDMKSIAYIKLYIDWHCDFLYSCFEKYGAT